MPPTSDHCNVKAPVGLRVKSVLAGPWGTPPMNDTMFSVSLPAPPNTAFDPVPLAEAKMKSSPVPIGSRSSPCEASAVSLPDPAFTRSLPLPMLSRKRSAPSPPWARSFSVPGSSVSLPAPLFQLVAPGIPGKAVIAVTAKKRVVAFVA